MGEYDENVLTQWEIPEEIDSYVQNLELGRHKFLRKAGEEAYMKFIDDSNLQIMNKQTVMGKCKWEFISIYSVEKFPTEDDKTIQKLSWVWAWSIFPDDEQQKTFRAKLTNIDVLPQLFKGARILTENENLVSIIMSLLSFYLKYDHIYVHKNGEYFNMFGLKDIEWMKISKNKKKSLSRNSEK